MKTTSSSISCFLLAAALAITSVACGADLIGAGKDGTPIPPPNKQNGDQTNPSGGSANGTDPGQASSGGNNNNGNTPATPTASGAPLDIEALFAPPTTDQVTPDSIFGVWAAADLNTEERIKVTPTELTLARKCKDDGRIGYVTVQTRASEQQITILETKEMTLGYTSASTCEFKIALDVGEWQSCSTIDSYDCFTVTGTKLEGLLSQLASSGISVEDWLKLSD